MTDSVVIGMTRNIHKALLIVLRSSPGSCQYQNGRIEVVRLGSNIVSSRYRRKLADSPISVAPRARVAIRLRRDGQPPKDAAPKRTLANGRNGSKADLSRALTNTMQPMARRNRGSASSLVHVYAIDTFGAICGDFLAAFFAANFLTVTFFATAFFAITFLAVGFWAKDFLTAFSTVFLAEAPFFPALADFSEISSAIFLVWLAPVSR